MASTKLAFLAVAAVLLLQASWWCGANGDTPAVMTVNSFENDGNGGGPAACDGTYHSNGEPLVALPTALYAGGSRCGKQIRITSTQSGIYMMAKVVDECDADSCKDNMISTSKFVWDVLEVDTYIGEVPITWSDA